MSDTTGTLRLTCANRGHHPEILLGTSQRHPMIRLDHATNRVVPAGGVGGRTFEALRAGRVEVVVAPDGHRTVHLRCPHPRCTRHVQLREEHAIAVVDRLIAEGWSTLDISRI